MALSKIGSAGLDTLSGNLIVNGNLGVGTASPTQALDVVRTSGSAQIVIDGQNATNTGSLLRLKKGGVDTAYIGQASIILGGGSTDNDLVLWAEGAIPQRFYTNGVERLRIDSAGRVTMPYQPCFSMDANGTVYGNSNVILSRGLNVGNCVNTSTGVFTAPVSGVYQFTAYSIKNNSSGTVARLTLKINGSAVGEARMDESGNYCQAAMIFIAQLSANDTANFANTDSTGFYMDGFYGRCTGQLIG